VFQLHSSGHYQCNYYTGSNGTGTLLHAGDLIEKVEPIIFLAVLIQNLYQQSSFAVTLIAEYSIKLNYCGVFIVHKLPLAISTSNGGPTGTENTTSGYQHNHKSNCIYYAVVR
jgi:hypothetical protein